MCIRDRVPHVITPEDRKLIVKELLEALTITTGWNADGTFDKDPANAETVPFKKAIAEIRGAALALANEKPFAQ